MALVWNDKLEEHQMSVMMGEKFCQKEEGFPDDKKDCISEIYKQKRWSDFLK